MSRNIYTTTLRLNLDNAADREAWEHLQRLDKKTHRSVSRAVIADVNAYFGRQEQLAAELLDQAAAEEEIMESEVDESERDELENRVRNCKLRAGRRKAIVAHVMNKRGVAVDDNWTDEGIGAAFAVLAASAKAKIGNRKPRKAPGSEPVKVKNANIGDPFARMMAFKNRKGDK